MLLKRLPRKYKVSLQEEYVSNDIEVDIYCRTWQTTRLRPKAIVIFVHGHNEHVSRYDAFFADFAKIGIKVCGFDQVGCGKTGEKAGDLGGALGLSRLLVDLNDVVERNYDPKIPLFLMGHSFGGMSVLNYLALGEQRDLIYGAIVAAPCVRLAIHSEPDFIVSIILDQLAAVFPLMKIPHSLDASNLSREQDAIETYKKDPLIMNKCSLIQMRDVVYEGKNFIKRSPLVCVPRLLLMHGTGDKIASYESTVAIFQAIKDGNKVLKVELKTYEDAYHELHNDTVKKEVTLDTISWILGQLA
ncbi:hypothetical protein DSO57_1011574 [Entomophthora muscae]|uniref:Uncharacterized protein n=1 Tax=Entomophthora muscae TaxID=34485 RepID=A0ACC2SV26_9FUNG|nr:hypothetical protein DSO57_1011574 [Entomophthora muscae]